MKISTIAVTLAALACLLTFTACACNDFVIEEDTTTGGGESSTGDDVAPDECQSSADCLPGELCDALQSPHICVPRSIPQDGEINGPCTVLTCWECHLASDLDWSICLAACENDENCASGTECIGGKCIYPCEAADDCPFVGMDCIPDPAPGMCMWKA